MYRNYNDGIESMKRRQWAVTNYVLLIFAAIIGFANLASGEFDKYLWLPFVLLLLAFFISSVGIYHLIDMHRVIIEYRYTLRNIMRMSYAKEIIPIKPHDYKFSKYFFSFTLLFILLILVGFWLVGFFLTKFSSFSFWTSQIFLSFLILIDIFLFGLFSRKATKDTQKFKKDLDKKHKLY
jgi:hypothetical protein